MSADNRPLAVVTGAGGFIGSHLVRRLKREGYRVIGADLKRPEWHESEADKFMVLDLRQTGHVLRLFDAIDKPAELYQLAADMGGMGYIHSAECSIMSNSARINLNLLDAASGGNKIARYFFSSSVCVYRDMAHGEATIDEGAAWPASPENEYGLEKLYAERYALACARNMGLKVRIARFQNTFGPCGAWRGGKEKAPAAMCRKVAEVGRKGTIEVWGDGSAVRNYMYIDDLLDGILLLMRSDEDQPTNIGTDEYVSVNELVEAVADVAIKDIAIKYVDGPVGVESRNFSSERIRALGWQPKHALIDGLRLTYPWIEAQVMAHRATRAVVGE